MTAFNIWNIQTDKGALANCTRGDHNFCFICGKTLNENSTKQVHLTNFGAVPDDKDFGENELGYYRIGNECAKKPPKEYIFESKEK